MSLRWKIALALAGLTFVASAVVGAAVYRVTKDRLLNEIDRSLAEVSQRPGRGQFDLDSMVSKTYPMESFFDVVHDMHEGKLARGVLTF